MNCKSCGRPSMVMGYKIIEGQRIYCKVQFKPASGVRSFMCGKCVAYGDLSDFAKPQKTSDITPTENLKRWRKEKGLTQVELASIVGVSQQLVSQVEKGAKSMPSRWERVLKAA